MELLYYGNKSGRAAKFAQNVPKKVSVDCIKCIVRSTMISDDAVHNIIPAVAGQQISCQLCCVHAGTHIQIQTRQDLQHTQEDG